MQRDKCVVYTYGAFDLLHCGHIKFLESAKQLGSKLIVGVLEDAPIKNRKGELRPLQPAIDRAKIISSLKCVDEVVMQPSYDPLTGMKRVKDKIDILTKGDDWDDICAAAEKVGCEATLLTYSQDYSTTKIVDKIHDYIKQSQRENRVS